MSLPEVLLWRYLRGRALAGLRFRRQHPIGPFILDFYCPEIGLCVEVDGYSHDGDRIDHDERRTEWLRGQGVRVIRFSAVEVLDNTEGVLKAIALVAAPSTAYGGPPPP